MAEPEMSPATVLADLAALGRVIALTDDASLLR